PYLVPGEQGMQLLARLRSRGVAVGILTNSLAATDVVAVHGGYARYREQMLRQGIALFEWRPDQIRVERVGGSRASLHAKAAVVDRRQVIIGSMNADPRTMMLN